MRRPEDPVHAGDLVDQGQRQAERMDRRRPLGFRHVGRILERVRVVHVLYAARERHDVGVVVVGGQTRNNDNSDNYQMAFVSISLRDDGYEIIFVIAKLLFIRRPIIGERGRVVLPGVFGL